MWGALMERVELENQENRDSVAVDGMAVAPLELPYKGWLCC